MRKLGALTTDFCLPPGGMTSATAFGPIIGPVGSITWLPVTAGFKIGARTETVNAPARVWVHSLRRETKMSLTLLAALVALIAWVVLVFFMSVTAGAVHLLLAVCATLLVRWWALRG
jgi:hypothetical protein